MNDYTIEKLLYDQVEKPADYLMTKIINVYSNKYRINVYCEKEVDDLMKKRICASYFCQYKEKQLKILSSNGNKSIA